MLLTFKHHSDFVFFFSIFVFLFFLCAGESCQRCGTRIQHYQMDHGSHWNNRYIFWRYWSPKYIQPCPLQVWIHMFFLPFKYTIWILCNLSYMYKSWWILCNLLCELSVIHHHVKNVWVQIVQMHTSIGIPSQIFHSAAYAVTRLYMNRCGLYLPANVPPKLICRLLSIHHVTWECQKDLLICSQDGIHHLKIEKIFRLLKVEKVFLHSLYWWFQIESLLL